MIPRRSSREITMAAFSAAEVIYNSLELAQLKTPIETVIISGKGWRVLDQPNGPVCACKTNEKPRRMRLNRISSFTDIADDFRQIAIVEVDGRYVAVLTKPIYLHEAPSSDWLRMLRIQIEMMALLGSRCEHRRIDDRNEWEPVITPAVRRMIFLDNGASMQHIAKPTVYAVKSCDTLDFSRTPTTASDHFVLDRLLTPSLYKQVMSTFSDNGLQFRAGQIRHTSGPIMPHGSANYENLRSAASDAVCMGLFPWLSSIGQYRHEIDCLALLLALEDVIELVEPEAYSERAQEVRPATTAFLRQLLLTLPA